MELSQTWARSKYYNPLRPDIAIRILQSDNGGLHLMDAKFRHEKLEEVLGDQSNKDLETEERKGTFLRGDIYKMHPTHEDQVRPWRLKVHHILWCIAGQEPGWVEFHLARANTSNMSSGCSAVPIQA
jgi:predicted component of viral defense system (DUF524 family)